MRAWLLAAAALLSGCAALDAPLREHLASESPQVRGCAEWFEALDARVEAASVRDGQETRLAGFPYLRVNRLLAALAPRAAASDAAAQVFALRLAALDQAARAAEIANLPDGGGPGAGERTRECGRLLREIDLAKPEARRLMLERAKVPDDYSALMRVVGLYVLTRIPFAAGVRRWEAETRAAFARPLPEGAALPRIRYSPPPAPHRLPGADGRPRGGPPPDALGIPDLAGGELEALLAAHAPSFDIETGGDFDRFGRLRWLRESEVPAVEASAPAVYAHAAHTLYRGKVLLQLVYTLWFPERPPREPGDLYSGTLDGLTWRATLAPDGEPLIYDAIHPCGCFHQFFPTPRAKPRPAPDSLDEWAFVPLVLPRIRPGERPLVRLASGTHAIEGVSLVRGADSLASYVFRAYEELRSLARMDGGRRSAFGPDGLIAGTERAERFLFWPMGIASAGAMRQWGRHATAFVGRRHFDDADLFERRFEFDLP